MIATTFIEHLPKFVEIQVKVKGSKFKGQTCSYRCSGVFDTRASKAAGLTDFFLKRGVYEVVYDS